MRNLFGFVVVVVVLVGGIGVIARLDRATQ
jgi:hypothetical protein